MQDDPCRYNQGKILQMSADVDADDADQDDGKPDGIKGYRERLDQENKPDGHQDDGEGHDPGSQIFLG